MDNIRYTKGEPAVLIAGLPHAGGVKIKIWKLDGTVVVNDELCVEFIDSFYRYIFVPTVTEITEYLWLMKTTIGTPPKDASGRITYGGWTESLLKEEHIAKVNSIMVEIDGHRLSVESNIDAKISTRATPKDIKDFTITRILATPRNLELIAKSVSVYYRGQIGTLVVMSRYAGLPTDVEMFVTIYYPNNEIWKDEVQMTPLKETGLYTYNFLVPEDTSVGVYKVKYKAIKSIAAQELADNFDEPDGIGGNWEVDAGVWEIRSNIYKQLSTSSISSYSKWKDPLSIEWLNYSIEANVRIDTQQTTTVLGVQARYQSATTRYSLALDFYYKKLYLARGTTELGSIPFTPVVGTWYKLKLEMIGARLRVYLNDTYQFERYDETIKTGRPALYVYNGLCSFDNILITIPAQEYQEFEVSDFKVEDVPGLIPEEHNRLMKTLTVSQFLGLK